MNSDEPDFRVRPTRPAKPRTENPRAFSLAFQQIMHIARMSSVRRRRSGTGSTGAVKRQFRQRCAVRITYSPNRTPGQWRAHGRYIERESAAGDPDTQSRGFDNSGRVENIGTVLQGWQAAGDRRLFKMIVSPEFGERADLERHARELIARMERDLGTRLQWVGVVHRNTEHPHVHIALRGVRADGSDLRLARKYIQRGIREHAEDLITQQIGYRTELDVDESYRRQVNQQGLTALDRILNRSNTAPGRDPACSEYFFFGVGQTGSTAPYIRKRLVFLRTIGLAEQVDSSRWRIRTDFSTVLKAMQHASDRQRAVAAHRPALSDDRLPISVVDWRSTDRIEGRVLGHGEDHSGRQHMIVEGTDHKLHFMYYSREIEDARAAGELRPGSFAIVSRRSSVAYRRLTVQDLGDAERLLTNETHMAQSAKRLIAEGRRLQSRHGAAGWAVMIQRWHALSTQHKTGADTALKTAPGDLPAPSVKIPGLKERAGRAPYKKPPAR